MTATLISSFVAGKHLNSAPSVPGRPELRNHGTQRLDVDVMDRTEPASFAFDRLVLITGALPPSSGAPFRPANRNDPQYKATCWLAQLAANVVYLAGVGANKNLKGIIKVEQDTLSVCYGASGKVARRTIRSGWA
jgi:hypothetical protein